MDERNSATTLLAGAVVDVRSGRVLQDQAIVVRDGSIDSVGPRTSSTVGSVVDLSAYTLIPGLIDCHTHLTSEADSEQLLGVGSSAARDAFVGARNAKTTVRAGITTVRDCGPMRALTDVALRDAISEGIIEGPRVIASGAYMSVTDGAADIMWVTPDVRESLPLELRFGVADTPAGVRRTVRRLLHSGADFIKINATGAFVAPGTRIDLADFSEEEVRAAVDEASRYGTYVAAHAHGPEGIRNAVRAGVRSIEHGWMLDEETAQLMVASGTYLVPTISVGTMGDEGSESGDSTGPEHRRIERSSVSPDRSFQLALEHGIKIALGTDSGSFPHGSNVDELRTMVRLGMPAISALRAATCDAADLLGLTTEVGALEPGHSADILAVAGDPTTDIDCLRAPVFVMARGEVVHHDTGGTVHA